MGLEKVQKTHSDKSGLMHMPAEFQVQKEAADSLRLQTALNKTKSIPPRVRTLPDCLLKSETLGQGTAAWYSGFVESYGTRECSYVRGKTRNPIS